VADDAFAERPLKYRQCHILYDRKLLIDFGLALAYFDHYTKLSSGLIQDSFDRHYGSQLAPLY